MGSYTLCFLALVLVCINADSVPVNAPGWKSYAFPYTPTHPPAVTLYGRSNATAVFHTKIDNVVVCAFVTSGDRGKTWGPATPTVIQDAPVNATPTVVGSGDNFYVFFMKQEIYAYRYLNSEFSAITSPLTATNLRSYNGTLERADFWGATQCGRNCISVLFGLSFHEGSSTRRYRLFFATSSNYGATWDKTELDTWAKPNSDIGQVAPTAAAIAFHHNAIVVGLSTRTIEGDANHSDLWKISKDGGKNWKSFKGWVGGYQKHLESFIDLQIIGRRNDKWSAIGILEESKNAVLLAGSDDDASWREIEFSTEGTRSWVYIAEYHQGLIALKPNVGNALTLRISLHAGSTWGQAKPLVVVDSSFNQWEINWDRHASFDLPYALVYITVTGEPHMLVLEDCGDNNVDIDSDSYPYRCCRVNGCAATPPPPGPAPGPGPTPTPHPPAPHPQPPGVLDSIDGDSIALAALAAFVGISVLLAVVSIVRRRTRSQNPYTDLSVNLHTNANDVSDSDGIALEVQ